MSTAPAPVATAPPPVRASQLGVREIHVGTVWDPLPLAEGAPLRYVQRSFSARPDLESWLNDRVCAVPTDRGPVAVFARTNAQLMVVPGHLDLEAVELPPHLVGRLPGPPPALSAEWLYARLHFEMDALAAVEEGLRQSPGGRRFAADVAAVRAHFLATVETLLNAATTTNHG